MSNKSRLQTNNANLQALIAKANALPDAGSGSSASATCTLKILCDAPLSSSSVTVYYVAGTGALQTQVFSSTNIMMGITLTCAKNSFVYNDYYLFQNTALATFENITRIDQNCIFVSGDATYTIT